MSPTRRMGRVGASHASASSLVARSATTTTAAVPQNTRRSATLAIFLLGLALDAEPGVRQRVEPLEHDVLAALLALDELLGRLIQPRRASMSSPRGPAASPTPLPSTSLRARVSPSTKLSNADTAATTSAAPATLNSMRVVYS